MLGSSARIGEVLAIRKCDIDVTVSPATVRICGTIVSPKGNPHIASTTPRRRSRRGPSPCRPSLPRCSASVSGWLSEKGPEHLIFFSRNHTPLTTNNIRRRLRAVLEEVEIDGVTPHSFRRTVATFLDPSWSGSRGGDARTHVVEDHQGALHPA